MAIRLSREQSYDLLDQGSYLDKRKNCPMHQRYLLGLCALLACLLIAAPSADARRNNDKQLINQTLSTWKVLKKNIKVRNVINKKDEAGVRTVGGTVTAFGHKTSIEVAFFKAPSDTDEKSEIRKISVVFPASAKLTTRHLRDLGLDLNAYMPGLPTMGVGIQRLELEVLERKVQGGRIAMSFGSWMPLGKGQQGKTVTLSEVTADFEIRDIQSTPRFQATVRTYLHLPDNLAQTMGIGATSLEMSGSLSTKPVMLKLGANLASKEIPLHPNRSVVLKNARFEFIYEGGKPALALAGKIELRPKGHAPIGLNGQVSFAATGQIYVEGWMDQSDSISLGNGIFLERAGLGFGANFSTGIPTPIVAIEGGLRIVDRRGVERARGQVTIGVDTGNPTRSVLDAELVSIRFADLVTLVGRQNIPREVARTVEKMTLDKVHLKIVPPGPGVTLFGIAYEPGLTAEADISYDTFRGRVYIDLDDSGVEASGNVSPIRGQGFAIEGTQRGTGPNFYLLLKPQQRVVALALNGKLQVMGASAMADVYFSDAGFSAKARAKVLGFDTNIDIAATSFSPRASVYAHAKLTDRDGIVQQLTAMAAKHIETAARDNDREFKTKQQAIATLKPRLAAAHRRLTQVQARVRKDYERLCALLDQRKAQETEKRRKEEAIARLRAEINREDSHLRNNVNKPAKALRSTKCPGGILSTHKDHCWSCPQGNKKDLAQAWDSRKACFKPGRATLTDPLPAPIYTSATKGAFVGCSSPLINDLGSCWECPRGYVRKVSGHGINTSRACTIADSERRTLALTKKRARLVTMQGELDVITKGVGKVASQLTSTAANSCQAMKSTELINADPRVAPAFKDWSALSLTVNEGSEALKLMRQTSTGALEASAWMARHGGRAAGIVRIQEATFDGCLSTLAGGRLAMNIRGSFAGTPFSGSVDLDSRNLAAGMTHLASTLMDKKAPRATMSNGRCTRPNVPRPNIGSGGVALNIANQQKTAKKAKPRPKNNRAAKPTWASQPARK